MTGVVLVIAVLCGLALGVALGLYGLYRTKSRALAAEQLTAARQQPTEDVAELRKTVEGLAAQLEELRREPAAALAPPPFGASLNLSKRSQALRMHRRGDSPEKIAAALEVPTQEIDLLIKVHRIVMSTVG